LAINEKQREMTEEELEKYGVVHHDQNMLKTTLEKFAESLEMQFEKFESSILNDTQPIYDRLNDLQVRYDQRFKDLQKKIDNSANGLA